MAAKILFFGLTAHIAQKREMQIHLSTGLSANDLLEEVRQKIPGLGGTKLHLSINQKFATGDDVVHDGDELAVFTAVSGG